MRLRTYTRVCTLSYHPDGQLIGEYSAYSQALGIKSVEWAPSGQFLAVGSYDQSLRLLNHVCTPDMSDLPPANLNFSLRLFLLWSPLLLRMFWMKSKALYRAHHYIHYCLHAYVRAERADARVWRAACAMSMAAA